jgi:hypothetical protein
MAATQSEKFVSVDVTTYRRLFSRVRQVAEGLTVEVASQRDKRRAHLLRLRLYGGALPVEQDTGRREECREDGIGKHVMIRDAWDMTIMDLVELQFHGSCEGSLHTTSKVKPTASGRLKGEEKEYHRLPGESCQSSGQLLWI